MDKAKKKKKNPKHLSNVKCLVLCVKVSWAWLTVLMHLYFSQIPIKLSMQKKIGLNELQLCHCTFQLIEKIANRLKRDDRPALSFGICLISGCINRYQSLLRVTVCFYSDTDSLSCLFSVHAQTNISCLSILQVFLRCASHPDCFGDA